MFNKFVNSFKINKVKTLIGFAGIGYLSISNVGFANCCGNPQITYFDPPLYGGATAGVFRIRPEPEPESEPEPEPNKEFINRKPRKCLCELFH